VSVWRLREYTENKVELDSMREEKKLFDIMRMPVPAIPACESCPW